MTVLGRRPKTTFDLDERPTLVVGMARTGLATAAALASRGHEVRAIDDRPSDLAVSEARRLGVDLRKTPARGELERLVASSGLVVLSPGVPPSHPVFAFASPERFISEIELASRLSDIPLVAITGTNGKTTVATLVAEMLAASGIRTRAVGNIGEPLVTAIEETELEVVVVEVSSFQLAYTTSFRPAVGTWLNIAEDHLDWHGTFEEYAHAKARIWAAQTPEDAAVANAEDDRVLACARVGAGTLYTFGLSSGDYRRRDDLLVGPDDEVLAEIADLPRALPHDISNSLAALASARLSGATAEGCLAALRSVQPLSHRVERVGEIDGVTFYDDSKATTPSAVCSALAAFASSVLIAGGRNKGLDLSAIARDLEQRPEARLRAVVAIGEAADEVELAFVDRYEVVRAGSMTEAVRLAHGIARPGDAVLLSPGCASFDWYSSYAERGDDFARNVRALESDSLRLQRRGG